MNPKLENLDVNSSADEIAEYIQESGRQGKVMTYFFDYAMLTIKKIQ